MRPLLEFRDGVRLAGHPLHAILIHFPLTLFSLVFPLEIAAWLGKWDLGWKLGFFSVVAALISAVPAIVTGLPDLLAVSKNPVAAKAGNLHMIVMLSAATLFGIDAFLRGGSGPISGPVVFVILGLSFFGTALLIWGGWLGGELIYHHGAGQIKK